MFTGIKRLASLIAAGAALVSLVLSLFVVSFPPPAKNPNLLLPKHPRELAAVSAWVLMRTSSGTGTILRSGPSGSDFLTNEHVCDDAPKAGAIILLDGRPYEVTAIKPSRQYDLCLMHVKENIKKDTKVSELPAKVGDEVICGGYPLGLPLVLQKGYVSRAFNIGERDKPEFVLLTSFIVQPGHSGSAIFNEKGEIVGVIEALKPANPKDSIGFGLAVPQQYVKRFIEKEAPRLPWVEVPRVKRP